MRLGAPRKPENPQPVEVLPEFPDGELDRNVHKLDRSKRQKLTTVEMEKLQNCDRPLNGEDWGEMSSGRQRVTLELMRLLKKEPTKGGRREGHSDNRDKSKSATKIAV